MIPITEIIINPIGSLNIWGGGESSFGQKKEVALQKKRQ